MRLITFDVTGTLLKFSRTLPEIYANLANHHGVQCNKNLLESKFKFHFKALSKSHPNFGLHSGLGWENWWQTLVINTFIDSESSNSENTLRNVSKDLIESFKTSDCWAVADGSFNLLNSLKSKNITLGVISNFDPRLPVILKNMQIYNYFTFVSYSYDVGFQKPDKRIFNKALELSLLPDIKSSEALHIGDSAELDYHAAIKAGWNAILVTNKSSEEMNVPEEFIFPTLTHVNNYFTQGNEKSSKNYFNA